MNNTLNIKTGISGDRQESSFMNATLTVLNNIAVSIAITPPDIGFETQGELAAWLREELAPLAQGGWHVEVEIGPDEEDLW